MKNLLVTLATIFAVALFIWTVGYTVPKIVDIYKNKPVEKVDTVVFHDTLYFERTVTDTLPEYRYETFVKRDTLYKWKAKGDSIEKVPRVIVLKKKTASKTLPLGDDTLTYNASITGWSVDNDSFPRLDSIRFNLKGYNIKDKEIITKTIIKRQKGFKIAPAIGAGYGVVNRKPDIWVGVSISYNF